jgi:hypothetical protein
MLLGQAQFMEHFIVFNMDGLEQVAKVMAFVG